MPRRAGVGGDWGLIEPYDWRDDELQEQTLSLNVDLLHKEKYCFFSKECVLYNLWEIWKKPCYCLIFKDNRPGPPFRILYTDAFNLIIISKKDGSFTFAYFCLFLYSLKLL